MAPYTFTYALLVKLHVVPVASLVNTKDVFAAGLVRENVVPNGFKKLVPFVILYGEFLVVSIALPLVSTEPER